MIINFLALLIAHWVGDFVFQTHWQATNKSKNWEALGRHVFNYSLTMTFAFMFCIFDKPNLLEYAGLFFWITFITHFITDAITSRMTSGLFIKGKYHEFFLVIGFDQLIHQFTLAATLAWLMR